MSACLPECDGGVDEAVRIYHQFASSAGDYADLERQHGVVAVDIVPIYEKDEEETKAEDEESAPNPYEDWWEASRGRRAACKLHKRLCTHMISLLLARCMDHGSRHMDGGGGVRLPAAS